MLSDETILHAPPLLELASEDAVVLVDAAAPNWVATDARGAAILRTVDGKGPRSTANEGRHPRAAPRCSRTANRMTRSGRAAIRPAVQKRCW
jgi:hypothetical protein